MRHYTSLALSFPFWNFSFATLHLNVFVREMLFGFLQRFVLSKAEVICLSDTKERASCFMWRIIWAESLRKKRSFQSQVFILFLLSATEPPWWGRRGFSLVRQGAFRRSHACAVSQWWTDLVMRLWTNEITKDFSIHLMRCANEPHYHELLDFNIAVYWWGSWKLWAAEVILFIWSCNN